MTGSGEPVLQTGRLSSRDLGDWRHSAKEFVVVRNLFNALRADASASKDVREKRADIVEPLGSTERNDENGIESRQCLSIARRVF